MKPYYEHAGITLYHGDCAEVLPEIGVKAQLILTSPPYDNLRTYGGQCFDFNSVADACVAVLAPGGVIVWVVADGTIDGSETGTSFRHALGFMERGLRLHDTMIYEKLGPPLTLPKSYIPAFEYMFVFSKGEPGCASLLHDRKTRSAGQINNKTGQGRARDDLHVRKGHYVVKTMARRTNVWTYGVGGKCSAPDSIQAHEHPAIFPLALASDHIRTWTNPGDLVIDPMAGSGTVLKAAKELGRKAIGVEINEPYLDIIQRRMAQDVLPLASLA